MLLTLARDKCPCLPACLPACWSGTTGARSIKGMPEPGRKPPPRAALALQCPVLTQCDAMPAGKGEMIAGSSSAVTNRAMITTVETERQ